jgi:hypothetical protein
VARLLRFAEADGWGRGRRPLPPGRAVDIAHYLEHLLPAQMSESPLANALPCGLLFAIDVCGPGGGQWSCRCGDGTLTVERGPAAGAVLTYRTDAATLERLILRRQTTQQAFFDGQIEIGGDQEKALKLAVLIEQFLAERPARPGQPGEGRPAAVAGGAGRPG